MKNFSIESSGGKEHVLGLRKIVYSHKNYFNNNVTWRLKAGIVEPERESIASQRLAKTRSHVNEDSTKVSKDTDKQPDISMDKR
jgi:hypothetical protein